MTWLLLILPLELKTLSQTAWNDHGPVLSYLRTAQNGDGGWAITEEGTSDILTAAKVVQALCLYQSVDPSLYNNVIAPAETFLDNNVEMGTLFNNLIDIKEN